MLIPTQREKRRYVAIRIEGNYQSFKKLFLEKYKELFGVYGLARAGIIFVDDFYEKHKIVVIRVKRGRSYTVLSTLFFLKSFSPRVVGVFPTLFRIKKKVSQL